MTPGPDEGRRTMDLFDMPESSPWGPVQNCKVLCPGAFQVDTASHGGVMINCEIIDLTLPKAAQKCGFHEGGYLCFEEDCAATVALRELMDKKLFTAPVNDYFKPGEYSKIIDQSVQRYYPEYWAARERGQGKSSIKSRLAERAAPAGKRAPKRKAEEVR